jgi:hypothetical protein
MWKTYGAIMILCLMSACTRRDDLGALPQVNDTDAARVDKYFSAHHKDITLEHRRLFALMCEASRNGTYDAGLWNKWQRRLATSQHSAQDLFLIFLAYVASTSHCSPGIRYRRDAT